MIPYGQKVICGSSPPLPRNFTFSSLVAYELDDVEEYEDEYDDSTRPLDSEPDHDHEPGVDI